MTSPVSIRYNNPGALNTVPWVRAMPGYVGEQITTPGNSTARFDTMEHGVAAYWELLRRYNKSGVRTMHGIISTYGGGQDYSAYEQFVRSKTHLNTPSTVVDLDNDLQLLDLAKAMFWYEAGVNPQQWITDAVILNGFALGRGKPATPAPPVIDLGAKVKATMLTLHYPWFDDQNVVSIEGMDVSGKPNMNRPNAFDDIKMVIDGSGKIIGGPWAATTQPGRYWTEHPMAEGGAFSIALGPQACWTPGDYHGYTVWRQAEDSTIMGFRDPEGTYRRVGQPIKHGNIGIHHHGGGDQARGDIGLRAAGCQVLEMDDDQAEFMKITMARPAYQNNKSGYRLTATVLTASQLTNPQPVPYPPPIVDREPTPAPQPPASSWFTLLLNWLFGKRP